MASSHGDHTVRVVDCKTFKCVKTLKGHPRTPWCITFHPSSDQLLASGCLGGQVRVWNLEVNFVSVPLYTTCTYMQGCTVPLNSTDVNYHPLVR